MMAKLKGSARYAPLENAPFDEATVERVASAANAILETGPLTRASFVEFARPDTSPVHDLLEWDDRKAAESHRLHTAGALIGSVYLIGPAGKPARAYQSVVSITTSKEAMRSYRPTAEVVADGALLGQVSIDLYQRIVSACERAESLGLDRDGAWRRIIGVARSSVPLGAAPQAAAKAS